MSHRSGKLYLMYLAVSLIACLLCTPSLEASSSQDFFNRLQGTWRGDGKTSGLTARLQMNWEWVLGRKFLRLSLRNETHAATGSLFEGHAYYRLEETGKCEGKWFDSRGASFPIVCEIAGDAMTAMWGTPAQEQGKSVYRFLESDKLEVLDSVRQKDGTWKEFGRFVVIRH
jgi:hypothetical protein